MEIRFVGIGGAFDSEFTNSSALLTLGNTNYLIDCGHSVFSALVKNELADKVHSVLITHLHDDHIGSLGTFGFYSYHFLGRKLNILLPNHNSFVEKFIRLVSLTMVNYQQYLEVQTLNLDDIEPIETTNLHYNGMETFSYIFKEGDTFIAYSGDLGDPHFLFNEIKRRKLKASEGMVFHDTSFNKNGAHSYYKDLMKWAGEFKIYCYHHNPLKNPSDNILPLVYNSEYMIE